MENADGISLMIGGSAVGAIVTLVGSWIKARYSKTQIDPQPLQVCPSDLERALRDNECEHKNLFARIATVEQAVAAIKERTASTDARLGRIENKLDRLIERTHHE